MKTQNGIIIEKLNNLDDVQYLLENDKIAYELIGDGSIQNLLNLWFIPLLPEMDSWYEDEKRRLLKNKNLEYYTKVPSDSIIEKYEKSVYGMEKLIQLCFDGARTDIDSLEDKRREFLDAFSVYITKNYYGDGRKDAEDQLKGVIDHLSCEMVFRIMLVSILFRRGPNEIFYDKLQIKDDSTNSLDIIRVSELQKSDFKFELIFSPCAKKIKSRLIFNDSTCDYDLPIEYKDIIYILRIKPSGILRSTFDEADNLIGFRGNLSFFNRDIKNYICVGLENDEIVVYSCKMNNTGCSPYRLYPNSIILDAAADGEFGVTAIKENYYQRLGDEVQYENKKPICAFGAGYKWAVQFNDCSIDSNLKDQNGQEIKKALSLVENGNESISVCSFDCNGMLVFMRSTKFGAKHITEKEYVDDMMKGIVHTV